MGRRALRFVLFVLISSALFVLPRNGSALDLGLTPSHVYSLWRNANECLLELAHGISDDADWRERLAAAPLNGFVGKKPSDVLDRLAVARAKVDRLRDLAGLPPVERFARDTREITPTIVYLNSGHILDGLVDLLIRTSGPDRLVSQFFARAKFTEKTPSDVLGLVDLANRRLARILAKADISDKKP